MGQQKFTIPIEQLYERIVRCNCNLNFRDIKKDPISIKVNLPKQGWLVVAHAPRVYLRNVKFIVSEASRQRAIKEGTRNVHAHAEGILVRELEGGVPETRARYNPFVTPTFVVRATGAELHSSPRTLIDGKALYVDCEVLTVSCNAMGQLGLF